MAITVDWITLTFFVPQGDLSLVTGTLYELDTEIDFRQKVNAIMASEDGIVFEDPITHNTEVTVSGTTYARFIEVINGYNLTFTPDSQWSVRLAGSNNNLFDIESGILNQNQVQVIPQNSAGLINASGAGFTADELAAAVWDKLAADHTTAGTMGELQPVTFPTAEDVANQVWDEAAADHVAAGSMGELQEDSGAGGVDVDAIADAVWDELLAGHGVSGSAGKALSGASESPDASAIADAVWDEVAGLHVAPGTMGALQAQAAQTLDAGAIANAVWGELLAGHVTPDSFGAVMAQIRDDAKLARQVEANRWKIDTTAFTFTVYGDDGVTPVKVFSLLDSDGNPDTTDVFERVPK